jgi:formate/nitrite transporter FocA (FNT family)
MTTLTGVLLATAVYSFSFAAQFIIISTTALGNLLGGILASAVLRAVGNTAEPAGAENK